jgi:hypothetical protein
VINAMQKRMNRFFISNSYDRIASLRRAFLGSDLRHLASDLIASYTHAAGPYSFQK